MAMFGALARLGSKLVRPIVGNSVVKSVVKQTALGGALYAAGNAMSGSSSKMPALPGGFPALPGAGGNPIVGQRGIFQNDPNVVAAIKPWAIAKTNLKVSYRSPIKGYVIRYDSAGDPYAVPKDMARRYLGWRPGKKPPISIGEYQALKKADRTVKKMRKIYSMISRVDKNVGKGGKVRMSKKGGK